MIFVDTGAWIALTDKSDRYHQDARAIYERLKLQRRRLVTTDYILDETVTRLRYDSGHIAAVRFLDRVGASERTGVLRLISVAPAIFQSAVTLFREYDTALVSLTDCTSFVVCEQYQITEAFAFDQHFLMRSVVLCTR